MTRLFTDHLLLIITLTLTVLMSGCGIQKIKTELKETKKHAALVELKYRQKTETLLKTSEKLNSIRGKLEEQQWRLSAVCVDHPDHSACAPYTNAVEAKNVFCKDPFFVKHVDQIIQSCHQGQCKQIDQAQQIDRNQYMMLMQGLPHTLLTFKANQTVLDRSDKRNMQSFLELLGGVKGYVVIVGRASKDGSWRHNIKLAVKRAESAREYIVNKMGVDAKRVGYITYGDEKMYLTGLDIERITKKNKRLSVKQANRSALIFSYPCYEEK